MRLGWRTPRVDSFKLAELAYTRIENGHKHKKTFIFTVFMWLLYVQLLLRTEQIRVCVSRWDQPNLPRTVTRKCSLRGLYVCVGRLDIENLLKSPLIYSIPWFSLGSWGFACRGEAHQSIPGATGLNPPELPISDEAWNDLHIASTVVKLR